MAPPQGATICLQLQARVDTPASTACRGRNPVETSATVVRPSLSVSATEDAEPRRRLRDLPGRLKIDLTPLRRSRDFRLVLGAGAVFYLGQMISYVALPYQIFDLTGSNFAVGAMAMIELVPFVFAGLYGGALADHFDRRKMLVVTGVAQAV